MNYIPGREDAGNQSSALPISQFSDLALEQVKQVAIGNPETVPAGDYARQVLTKIKIWDKIQGKVNLVKDVKTIVGYVETAVAAPARSGKVFGLFNQSGSYGDF